MGLTLLITLRYTLGAYLLEHFAVARVKFTLCRQQGTSK